VINPCDFCVANKTINGKQRTVVWHVDDLKISHVDCNAVTTILNLLDAKHGQEIVGGKRAPTTIKRGKTRDHLGMTLDHSETGAAKVNMIEHLKKVLVDMPTDMDGTATSPAGACLWTKTPANSSMLPSPNHCFFANEDAQTSKLLLRSHAPGCSILPSTTTTSLPESSNICEEHPSLSCASVPTI
jgi:hypothetical protein